jgi:hypothetical protein
MRKFSGISFAVSGPSAHCASHADLQNKLPNPANQVFFYVVKTFV